MLIFLFVSHQGQLYKVNVPVVVTQAAAGQQSAQKVTQLREATAPQPPPVQANTTHPQEVEPSSVQAAPVTHPPPQKTNLPSGQESSVPQQPPGPDAETSQPPTIHSPEPEVTLGENVWSPQAEPMNLSMTASPCKQLLEFQIRAEEALAQTAPLKSRDVDDILKEVIEEERGKAERARNLAPDKTGNQADAVLGVNSKTILPVS